MSLQSSFSVKLSYKIIPRSVCVGQFDGQNYSLAAAATASGKVFLHTPNAGSFQVGGRLTAAEADVSILNINQDIRSLAAGCLVPSTKRDVLVVGTPTHVLAYDLYDNSDLFYKDIPDGVNCICVGNLGGIGSPLALIGGNCAIMGLDSTGQDLFWTVTGDNVCSICLIDFTGDGQMELAVGSEDFDIRVFKQDEIIAEMTETEAVTHILPISGHTFAYALSNGTLGVYQKLERLWRIKSKNHVTSMTLFDVMGNNEVELVVGWSNGKIDIRRGMTGEVILKETLSSCVAGLSAGPYFGADSSQLFGVGTDGEVCGFHSLKYGGKPPVDESAQETLRELEMQKQNLLIELKNYQENERISSFDDSNSSSAVRRPGSKDMNREQLGIIPANTQLQTTLYINPGSETEEPSVELYVSTTNDTVVRCVMIFAEGVFPGESYIVHPLISDVGTSLKAQIRPQKDIAVELHVKALVGYKSSAQFHVFELTRAFPKFAMYGMIDETSPLPENYVTFTIQERLERAALWVNENFLVSEEVSIAEDADLNVRFQCLRNPGVIALHMERNGKTTIHCSEMDLCGEVIQNLAQFFGLEDLETVAEFPKEVEELVDLLGKVNEMYETREKMSADMADQSGFIKALLIRAEEARVLHDIVSMKKHYSELYKLNQELIAQYKQRSSNHNALLDALKSVNQIIQRAGRLRGAHTRLHQLLNRVNSIRQTYYPKSIVTVYIVGKPKTEVVNACRNAIRDGNTNALPKIIRLGV